MNNHLLLYLFAYFTISRLFTPPPFQSQTSSTPSLILKSSALSLGLTSFLSDCPSMTLCSCWSCSVMVLRILGELAPLTTATKTPPCKKNWWKFYVKKLLKSQFSENRSFFLNLERKKNQWFFSLQINLIFKMKTCKHRNTESFYLQHRRESMVHNVPDTSPEHQWCLL